MDQTCAKRTIKCSEAEIVHAMERPYWTQKCLNFASSTSHVQSAERVQVLSEKITASLSPEG